MDSPLARTILAVLGGYLIILLGLLGYDWISNEFPVRPQSPPRPERIQHPVYHPQAVQALESFSRLPQPEKAAIKVNLESNLVALEKWLTWLGQDDHRILCIGERHEESTRNFLAEEFFAAIKIDTLMLETTPARLHRLIHRMQSGRDYFPLLDADIMRILRAAIRRNPDIEIRGIEETDNQQNAGEGPANSRDRHIATNFWKHYQPGKRHIILFGALHCTDQSNWLFHNLRSQAAPPLKKRMLNVSVLGEHQNGPLEAFVFFLEEIGIKRRHFVIPAPDALDPRIYAYFPVLKRQTLDQYQAVIVFRV